MFLLVYFYNFGWKDYGVASFTTILDMVKVMTFALQEGRVAIHCHAGLGRTGKNTQPLIHLKLALRKVAAVSLATLPHFPCLRLRKCFQGY